MRLFVAIDIDESIQEALGRLQRELQESVDIKKSDVKWVRPDLMHLTLKFLGEVKDVRIAEVCDIVAAAVSRHERFELDVAKVGCFGGSSARVLWVGMGEKNDCLASLQKDIEQGLAGAGWPAEQRKFAGHLTLCRIRNAKAGRKLARLTEDYEDLYLGSVPVDSVCLYQSQLTEAGPIYTVLSRTELQ